MRNIKTLLAASAIGLFLAAPAGAQGYGYDGYSDDGYYQEGDVNVYTPRTGPRRSVTGAEIRDVEITRAVPYHDLDLRTAWGARELRDRIRVAARELCMQLENRPSIATGDSPPCYTMAVRNAMYQADIAIDGARRYASAW